MAHLQWSVGRVAGVNSSDGCEATRQWAAPNRDRVKPQFHHGYLYAALSMGGVIMPRNVLGTAATIRRANMKRGSTSARSAC